eukprot:3154398-Pleurochrysis_carterae.AAC.1
MSITWVDEASVCHHGQLRAPIIICGSLVALPTEIDRRYRNRFDGAGYRRTMAVDITPSIIKQGGYFNIV